MDTSEKYIEMCRAADEIQKGWTPEVCDWRASPRNCGMLPHACIEHPLYVDKESEFWLPRQDQLQALLLPKLRDLLDISGLMGIAEGFYDYLTTEEHDIPEFDATPCYEYGSMEQLWLAYVMKTKYGKTWDGAEWIDPDAPKEPLLPRIPQMILNFEHGSMQAKYITMNQKTLHRISSEQGETSLPLMYIPRICDLIPGIDDSLADDIMEIDGSPKEPYRSLLSQILEAHTRVKARNFKPDSLYLSQDAAIALSCELDHAHIGVMCRLGVDVRILDMKVIIDDTISDGEFQIMGTPICQNR